MWHYGLMATLDPPLDLLRSQILAATGLTLAEIGWIAGASHRQEGAHFPEYPPPPGNPPYEVDAIDVPHIPSRGADVGVLTESLRRAHASGRDNRLRLVIFNGRQWTNYERNGVPPFTWRDYDGEDDHSGHGHLERTDVNRTNLTPWEIDMFDAEAERKLNFVYAFLTTGGDISCGPVVPEVDRLPGLIAKVARKGNSLPEQLNSIRRLASEAAAGTAGQIDVEALADALASRLSRADATALADALNLRFSATPSPGV